MKNAWRVVIVIIAIAFGLAIVCGVVGMITGAELSRIYGEFESYFGEAYNVDLGDFINVWLPEVLGTLRGIA